ncbi:MAG: hypothetical protein QF441_01810 [Bacteriovoracaceae bacterium]|jgi:hypothetical protein|nr:hypothetical protein [Bacteriovoracaceae bacterium]
MKSLLVLAVAFFSLNAAAFGYQNFSYSVTAPTEAEVLVKAEATIPMIENGQVKSPFQKYCWPTNPNTVTVNSVSVSSYYKVGQAGEMTKVYKAMISYTHSACNER